MSSSRMRYPRPTRTAASCPDFTSRYTVMFETRSSRATSATVRKRPMTEPVPMPDASESFKPLVSFRRGAEARRGSIHRDIFPGHGHSRGAARPPTKGASQQEPSVPQQHRAVHRHGGAQHHPVDMRRDPDGPPEGVVVPEGNMDGAENLL